jgi:hypothetical protein
MCIYPRPLMKLTINRRYCYKFFIFTVIKYLGSNSKKKNLINSFSIDKLLDRGRENYVNMPLLEEVGFKGRSLGGFPQDREVPKTVFGPG